MKDRKSFWIKLLCPPLWLVFVLAVICTAALITVFLRSLDSHPIAYIVYVISAYTVTAISVYCVKVVPKYYCSIRQKIFEHPLGHRYMTDDVFKVRISLYISLGVNLSFAAMKLIMSFLYSSFWLGAVAVYYVLLSLLRFFILHYMRADDKKQNILYDHCLARLCGILLLLLNMALSGIVFQMVWKNEGYFYPGTLIFAVGAYTFYAIAMSISDMIKYRRYKNPVLSAAKTIRFAEALVSLLSLETAMLAQFSDDESYRFIMVLCTGIGVSLIVLGASASMIVRSNKEIKHLKEEKH